MLLQPDTRMGIHELIGFQGKATLMVEDLLTQAGLGERPSELNRNVRRYRDEYVWSDVDGPQWRLLRGQPAWLSMYSAAAHRGEGDQWLSAWGQASAVLAFVLGVALTSLAADLSLDWLKNIDVQHPIHGLRPDRSPRRLVRMTDVDDDPRWDPGREST